MTPAPALAFDESAAARRLGEAVAIRSISFSPAFPPATEEFRKLHALLEASFPRTHAALKRETVGGLSLLYTWPGTDTGAKPAMLMAHQASIFAGLMKRTTSQIRDVRDAEIWVMDRRLRFVQPFQRGELAEHGFPIFLDEQHRHQPRAFALQLDVAKVPGDIPA